MGRHRHDEDVSRTDPTEILPLVKERRLHASPVLLAAGAVALTLVLGVGGWAIFGSRGDDGPLVFPWSADKPGEIDVSVSMVPTAEPTASELDGLVPSPTQSKTVRRSAPPQQVLLTPAPVSPNPSPSPAPPAASVASISGRDGNLMINVDVRNTSSAPLATWTVELWFDKELNAADQLWNAKMEVVDARHLKFTAERALNAGQTIRFGFIAGYPSRRPQLRTCQIDGVKFSCSTD